MTTAIIGHVYYGHGHFEKDHCVLLGRVRVFKNEHSGSGHFDNDHFEMNALGPHSKIRRSLLQQQLVFEF